MASHGVEAGLPIAAEKGGAYTFIPSRPPRAVIWRSFVGLTFPRGRARQVTAKRLAHLGVSRAEDVGVSYVGKEEDGFEGYCFDLDGQPAAGRNR